MERQLGKSKHILQIPAGDKKTYLHDERDRRIQLTAEKSDHKAKSVFPTDGSLFKMLYPAMIDITRKWTGRRIGWGKIHAQLSIYFEGRMPE